MVLGAFRIRDPIGTEEEKKKKILPGVFTYHIAAKRIADVDVCVKPSEARLSRLLTADGFDVVQSMFLSGRPSTIGRGEEAERSGAETIC